MVVILAGLTLASSLVVPFLMATFLAILASPLVGFLTRRKVPQAVAAVMVVVLMLGVLSLVSVIVTSSVNSLASNLPAYQGLVLVRFDEALTWASTHGIDTKNLDLQQSMNMSALLGVTSNILSGLAGLASNIVLVLIVTAFMLSEGPSLHEKLENVLERRLRRIKEDPLEQATEQVQRYLLIKTITSVVTGVLAGVYCAICGLELALFWGFLAFLLNYIPTIGSIIASIPAIIMGFVLFGPGVAVAVGIGYLVINTIIGNVVEPKLMGQTLGLSPTVILFSMVFWGWLFGAMGALLSAPLTMIVKIVCDNVKDWNWIARMLDSPAEEARRERRAARQPRFRPHRLSMPVEKTYGSE